jgi:TM2 domain-containing membrane protein YozV
MLNADAVRDEEDAIRDALAALGPEQRKAYYRLSENRIKDPDTYATVNYFLVCGLHHFYLGKWLRGAINLIAFMVGAVFLFTPTPLIGVIVIAAIVAVELPALFMSQSIVRHHNNKQARQILRDLGLASSA